MHSNQTSRTRPSSALLLLGAGTMGSLFWGCSSPDILFPDFDEPDRFSDAGETEFDEQCRAVFESATVCNGDWSILQRDGTQVLFEPMSIANAGGAGGQGGQSSQSSGPLTFSLPLMNQECFSPLDNNDLQRLSLMLHLDPDAEFEAHLGTQLCAKNGVHASGVSDFSGLTDFGIASPTRDQFITFVFPETDATCVAAGQRDEVGQAPSLCGP